MTRRTALLAAALFGTSFALHAQTLRIGLQDDADVLDPAKARTFVGRIVFTSLCDKLVDINKQLDFVPQLATSWSTSEDGKTLTMKLRPNVTFQDGTKFDAEAVKFTIERNKTLPDSVRKSELSSVQSVEAPDPLTVVFHLSEPDSTLIAQLSDRAGMIVSPTAAKSEGDNFGLHPVCAGPYKFVDRVAQDHITLERYDGYWNKDAYKIQRVTFVPIPDTTVRLANLQSGQLSMLERLAAPDVKAVKADPSLQFVSDPGLGYQALYINVGNGDKAKNPVGQDKRVRQALELALDRDAINQVVFEGVNPPTNQPFGTASKWYDKALPIKAPDIEKAKALLKAAGVSGLSVEIAVANSTQEQQVAQLIQSMWSQIGVDVHLRATEFVTLLKESAAGNFQISQFGWSGRVDPDGNIHQFVTCKAGLNYGHYCNEKVDALLNEARRVADAGKRKALYDEAQAILLDELPVIYTYQQSWLWALSAKVKGFVPYPDGMIRLAGMTVSP